MKNKTKIIIIISLIILILLGVGIYFYLNKEDNNNNSIKPIMINIKLKDGTTKNITYNTFDNEYVNTNQLDIMYNSLWKFKDKVKKIENVNDVAEDTDEKESGTIIMFKSGIWVYLSKQDMDRYNEKMKEVKVGETLEIQTYFTERSNRAMFPYPVLMPMLEPYPSIVYDYDNILINGK